MHFHDACAGRVRNHSLQTRSTLDYSIVNRQTVLRYTMDQSRGAARHHGEHAILDISMVFTVDENMTCAVSGGYAVDDAGAAGYSALGSRLYNQTCPARLVPIQKSVSSRHEDHPGSERSTAG